MITISLKIVLYLKQLYLLFLLFNIMKFVLFHTFEQPINIGMCVSLIFCKTWKSISKTSSFSIENLEVEDLQGRCDTPTFVMPILT